MFYFRKNINNSWTTVKLDKEDYAKVESNTIMYGLRTWLKIGKLAEENKVALDPITKVGMLIWFALKGESFANDIIESQTIKKQEVERKGSATSVSA